ncbi:MAG: 6-phosphofructokinase [Puniceicoccales bacterium]|jgi:6-phosphofructokinase 1|nr:6-phosphofructokinase [Puniceicoccales bacterium]
MEELQGSVLILQIGKPTAVTNVILAALIKRALNFDCVEEIYGCMGGISKLLSEQFVDLAEQQQKNIANLIGTPGAALKSIHCDITEAAKIIEVLQKNNIRYLFVIGDESSIGICKELNKFVQESRYEMRIMLIPTSDHNRLQLTDHCLGYGSMAKHLAIMAKSIITNVQSTQTSGAITILELKGCDDEWLVSSLALARLRKDSADAPHLLILSNFDEGTFVKNVHQTIRNIGNCVIVLGDRLMYSKKENSVPQHGAAEYIKFISNANFDVQIDLISLHDWELTACMTLSEIDVIESELCVQKALDLSISGGISGKMITLLRTDGNKYSAEANCVDLENISDKKKEFPESWYIYENMALDISFFKYAMPLIAGEVKCAYENGLPSFARLR